MQRIYIFLSLIFFSVSAYSNPEQQLENADSLFVNQKYTQAFDLYDSIYQQDMASKSMLLKMAYVQEGLGNYPLSIKYLYIANQHFPDEEISSKIEALAKEHGYQGHQYSDEVYLLSFLRKYQVNISYGLFFTLLLCSVLFGYFKLIKKQRQMALLIFMMLSTVALFLLEIIIKPSHDAIVMTSNAHIYSKPSAGGQIVQELPKGDKFQIKESVDIWYRVKWNDSTDYYIRKSHLTELF